MDFSGKAFLTYTLIACALALDTIPVFIIDEGVLTGIVESQPNPFLETSTREFASIVSHIVKHSDTLILFIEDQLSMEDITSKDEIGTAFPHLRTQFLENNVKMFLRVVNAYDYLKSRFESYDFNTFYLSSLTTKLRLEDSYKFMYVYFDDSGNETRIGKLRRHDAIMRQVYFALKQLSKGNVIALYTGKRNPVTIQDSERWPVSLSEPVNLKPEYRSSTDPFLVEIECQDAFFQFYDPKIFVYGTKASSLEPVEKDPCVRTNNTLDKNIQYDLKFSVSDKELEEPMVIIIFIFTYPSRENATMWKLIEISFRQQDEIVATVQADKQIFHHVWFKSATPLTLEPKSQQKAKKRVMATWYAIVFGSFKPATTTEPPPATTPYYKSVAIISHQITRPDVIFSIGIGEGMLVVFAWLLILAWGLKMLFSINTNSHYDDPNSKPVYNNPETVTE